MKKRFLLLLMLAFMISALCGCGDVSKVKYVTEISQHFTTEEIESGYKVIENYFRFNFDNCVLKELRFVENSESAREKLIERYSKFDDLPESDDIIEYKLLVDEYQDGELRSSELPYHCRLGRLNKGSWTILDIGFD